MENQKKFYSNRQKKPYFRLLAWIAGWSYWLICNIYFRFMPRTTINQGILNRIDAQPLKGIMVPWHCYVPYGWWMIRNRMGAIMISRSNFGMVAASITQRMGCIPVRGGTSSGSVEALAQMAGYVKKGYWAMIIGDGPRGPKHVCKNGPVLLAQLTGQPLIPVSFSAKRKWTLNSWDRMIIPKPFSPILWVYGDPFYVPRHLDRDGLETKRQELEKVLCENHQRAENYWKSNV